MTSSLSLQLPVLSPGVNHVVAVELLRQPDKLPPGVRKVLDEATKGNSPHAAENLRRIYVTADLTALLLTASLRQENEQERMALEKFVTRHAHWPLLQRIFGKSISSSQVAEIRRKKKIQPPPRGTAAIPEKELALMWATWRFACEKYQTEKERWLLLSDRFQNYPLSAIYRAVIIDAAPKKGATE